MKKEIREMFEIKSNDAEHYNNTEVNNSFFSNPGKLLKNFSIVILFVSLISTFFLAFIVYLNISFIIKIYILIVGCFASYLSALILYGFGTLVENSDKNRKTLDEIKQNQKDTIKKEK